PGSFGVFPLTYSYTNSNGCTNTATVDITVGPITQFANAGPDTSICQSSIPIMLPASPAGGSWIGAGAGGSFTPSLPGSYLVEYNYGSSTCATTDQMTITVLASPLIVVPDDYAICNDAAAMLLTASPQGGSWSGNGLTGPPWYFDPASVSPGQHILTYSFSDQEGCTSTDQVIATVNAVPVVDAGPDLQLCDQPVTFQLSATPPGGNWTSGWLNVTSSGLITPGGVGTDQLIYTYTSAAGCTNSDQITVDVVAIDEPAFAGTDTAVCIDSGDLQLIGSPVGGMWSGTGVSDSGIFSPSLAGDQSLTYSFGSATCLIQDQIIITVHALPLVDAGENIGVCLDGGPQTLTASPIGGTWSGVGVDPMTGVFDPLAGVEGGNQVTYTFTDPITGCENFDVALVTINALPEAAFSNAPIACAGVPFTFNNMSIGATSALWEFGDGGTSTDLSPTHTYVGEGAYDVMLIASTGAGCVDTTYGSVTVWDVPQADFTLDVDSGCGPLEVGFFNSSIGEGLSYLWDLGGITSSIQEEPAPIFFPSDPLAATTYTVVLSASNSCGTTSVSAPIVVMPSPTAIISPDLDTYCAYADVPIVNASIGLPDNFQWDLGDGTTSTSADPMITHSYGVEVDIEEFTITLIASNECGSDTAAYTITILPNEVTAFFNTDPISGCAPLVVDLTQYSTGDTSWYWDLGDGNVSNEADLSHLYEDPGIYVIELHAFGCGYDSYSMEVEVLPSPTPSFSAVPETVCVGEEITFTNTTPDVADVEWQFGDGDGSSLSSIQHSYNTSGTYDVTLTVTSILNGCTASVTQPVLIGNTPVAAFTPSPLSGCVDLEVSFQNSSTNSDAYQWFFGDGNSSASTAPIHIYTEPGSHTLTLIAENLNGCSDTATALIIAHPLPVSAFQLSQDASCFSPITIQTLNNSTGAIGYSWDLGNGGTSVLNQPSITFEQPGTFEIELVAISQFGCTDFGVQEFTVHPTPEAAFNAQLDPGCAQLPVTFMNTSLNSSEFQWWFGDGEVSDGQDPQHVYEDPGAYEITLIATGAGGCMDTLVVTPGVQINPTPTADFSSDTLSSLRHALRFSNLSSGAQNFVWDFGDGEASTVLHPIHLFPADGGGFTVCLVAINEFTCTDTICKFVQVEGDPDIYVPNTFTPNSDGANDIFHPVLNGFVGWNYTLMIFDRWGEEIHRTTDLNEGWSGHSRGTAAPIDVYVWKVVVEKNGNARDFIGHVSLVR
ncbi:MAG: PKD domain-containing protein, partial [Bacteroidota bacterium]|nr:PKD domain-containing protein [Bacteroidota bacterium]